MSGARLIALGAPAPGQQFPLAGVECVVGRALDCDIAIQDQRISRRHARVVRTSEGLRLEDLGSVNGTFLNRRRVEGAARLANGDEIAIGSARFVVELPDERGAAESAGPAEGRVTVVDANAIAAGAGVVEVANLRPGEGIARKRTDPGDAGGGAGSAPATAAAAAITAVDPARAVLESIAFAREVERLELKLRTLYQVSEAVASALEPRALLARVVEQLLEVFPQAETAVAVVLEPRSNELRTAAFRTRRASSPTGALNETVLSAAVVDRVLRQGHSVLLRRVAERPSSPDTGARVTTVPSARDAAPTAIGPHGAASARPASSTPVTGLRMGAPLSFRGQHLGILHVEAASERGGFDQADLDLLGGIAAQAGVALHLARMHQKQLVQDRLDKDLAIARQIQRSLLPRAAPRLEGVEFAVHYEPAYHVGGDFFDYLWLGPQRLGLVVGDVSGKAISGALFMARVASEFRASAPVDQNPRRLLSRVNRAVVDVAEDGMFCTAVCVSLELPRQIVRVCNAGHTPPLLLRDGQVTMLDTDATRAAPLGVESEFDVGEVEAQLRPGDVLLLYTDGLLEARDAGGEFYGAERLRDALARARGSADEIVRAVLADLDAFVQDAAQADDQTIVCMRVTAEASYRCDSTFPPAGSVPPGRL